MKTTIIAGLLCVFSAIAHGAEVVASGVGITPETAITNAKQAALGQVAGTFVVGKHQVRESQLSSEIDEYVGGHISRFEVLNVTHDGELYHAEIKADVDTDKLNERIEAKDLIIPSVLVDEASKTQDEYYQAKRIITSLDNRSQSFYAHAQQVSYANRGQYTTVTVEVMIGWQPKWADDFRVAAKTIGRDHNVYDKPSDGLWGVAAIAAAINPIATGTFNNVARLAHNRSNTTNDVPAACFGIDPAKGVDVCYGILHQLQNVTSRAYVDLRGTMVMTDGTQRHIHTQTIPLESNLFRFAHPGQQLYFEQGGYVTFVSPSVLIFQHGVVYNTFKFSVPSEQLSNIQSILLEAS